MPSPRAFTQQRMPGAGPINDDVPGAGLLHELAFKVVDSCWISSTEWSDAFRSFFVYGKEQES